MNLFPISNRLNTKAKKLSVSESFSYAKTISNLIKVLLDSINNHTAGYGVFTTYGNDNVGITLAGLNKRLVHGLYG